MLHQPLLAQEEAIVFGSLTFRYGHVSFDMPDIALRFFDVSRLLPGFTACPCERYSASFYRQRTDDNVIEPCPIGRRRKTGVASMALCPYIRKPAAAVLSEKSGVAVVQLAVSPMTASMIGAVA